MIVGPSKPFSLFLDLLKEKSVFFGKFRSKTIIEYGVATFFGEELQQEFDTVAVTAQCVRAESPLARQVNLQREIQGRIIHNEFWARIH